MVVCCLYGEFIYLFSLIIAGFIYVEKPFACSLNAFDVNPLCISVSRVS